MIAGTTGRPGNVPGNRSRRRGVRRPTALSPGITSATPRAAASAAGAASDQASIGGATVYFPSLDATVERLARLYRGSGWAADASRLAVTCRSDASSLWQAHLRTALARRPRGATRHLLIRPATAPPASRCPAAGRGAAVCRWMRARRGRRFDEIASSLQRGGDCLPPDTAAKCYRRRRRWRAGWR